MAGFWRRMRMNNEEIGCEWLRDDIADKEAEIEQMKAVLARHEAIAVGYRSDYERARLGGTMKGV